MMCSPDREPYAAIFDVDGTLVDSMDAWRAAPERLLGRHGLVADDDLAAIFNTQGLTPCCTHIAARFPGLGSPDVICEEIFSDLLVGYQSHFPAMPHATTYLDALRQAGVRMCVLTANERFMVEPALNRLGMAPFLSFVMTCPEEGLRKSDPALFLRCANRLSLPPERCVVFEDHPVAARHARAAGMRTVGICDRNNPSQQQELSLYADRVITDYSELLERDIF